MEDKLTTLNNIAALYALLEDVQDDVSRLTQGFSVGCDVSNDHLDGFDQVLNTLSIGLSNISAAASSLLDEMGVADEMINAEYLTALAQCNPECPAVKRAIKLLTIEKLTKELYDEKVNGHAVDAGEGHEAEL